MKSIKILTEDRNYWKNLCSELSDKGVEMEVFIDKYVSLLKCFWIENNGLEKQVSSEQRKNKTLEGIINLKKLVS